MGTWNEGERIKMALGMKGKIKMALGMKGKE